MVLVKFSYHFISILSCGKVSGSVMVAVAAEILITRPLDHSIFKLYLKHQLLSQLCFVKLLPLFRWLLGVLMDWTRLTPIHIKLGLGPVLDYFLAYYDGLD